MSRSEDHESKHVITEIDPASFVVVLALSGLCRRMCPMNSQKTRIFNMVRRDFLSSVMHAAGMTTLHAGLLNLASMMDRAGMSAADVRQALNLRADDQLTDKSKLEAAIHVVRRKLALPSSIFPPGYD